MKKRHILVTAALPYANGQLHLGHLVGYIQSDIWTRFQRMRGNTCWFVSGSDAHGTPIMLYAQKLGITPEDLVTQVGAQQKHDFADFEVDFDNFSSTDTEENRTKVYDVYGKLVKGNYINRRVISQLYDPQANMFLPDRYVKGECPKCGSPDQYGDACEVCGATYSPMDLKHPKSVVSGATPETRESEHLFFRLPMFEKMLQKWMKKSDLQEHVVSKLSEWFTTGLQEWDISRDSPYFGFEIPDAPGKYFYVWLDAPIGYMASFQELCNKKKLNFDDFWGKDSKYELYHFIGKDIIYFHALFWPAVLEGAGMRLPTGVSACGFLTVNGQKMSKSRGTFIKARTYLNHCRPEYLRYYYATKLSSSIEDVDLNLDDFINKVNSDLVGKVVNIASRCAKFINTAFDNQLANEIAYPDFYNPAVEAAKTIAECYEKRDFSKAMREIMAIADQANQFIDYHKPWALMKDARENESEKEKVQLICTQGLNLFRLLILYLKPVLPSLARGAEQFLNIPAMQWEDSEKPLLNHHIQEYVPLLSRLDKKQVDAMLEQSQEDLMPSEEPASSSAPKTRLQHDPINPTISIEDFSKIDLRVAKVLNAEEVPEAEKLIKLTVDVGGEHRTIFAGIKAAYQPEELIGKFVVIVANLQPRKMRFGLSEGMLLATGPGGKDVWVIEPHEGVEPGMRVK